MGWILGLHCTNCEYKEQYYLGEGMLYSDEFTMQHRLSELRSTRLRKYLQNVQQQGQTTTSNDYKEALFFCLHCKILHQRLSFTLRSGQSTFTPIYCCGTCRRRLQLVKKDHLAKKRFSVTLKDGSKHIIHCPKCHVPIGQDKDWECGLWD